MRDTNSSKYNHLEIENKLIGQWEKGNLHKTPEILDGDSKYYSLYSFPYPSGSGLHVGHAEGMVANDIMARYYRMKGRKVTLPMGWDAFGLPAENFAIKTGTPPQKSTDDAIQTFINQIKRLGISVDWEKEVGSHRPDYYKWTQWFFSKLYEYGLAYKGKATVNWCPKDMTVLANEQVVEGKCERCDSDVEQKEMDQWFFKITDYADRLINDLDKVDWPDATKQTQINWIGKSEGAHINFDICDAQTHSKISSLDVFTTAHDTIFGVTFMVIAPEHHFLKDYSNGISNLDAINSYIQTASQKTNIQRQQQKDKTGLKIEGIYAVNPINNEKIPIYVADYVLVDYGTGAIMAVPGHDERDKEFATKYGIDIKYLVNECDEYISYSSEIKKNLEGFTLKNSREFDGLTFLKGRELILNKLVELGVGKAEIEYKLRDWLISRQRYWGAPIPVIWKERKQADKVMLVHGFGKNGDSVWFPWIKNELGKMNHVVISPDLPETNKPNLDRWVDTMESFNLTENSSIIGHSMGAYAGLKYAETQKLKQLILVAPTNLMGDEYWNFVSENFPDWDTKSSRNFYTSDIDPKKISENVEEIVFVFSSDDPYITPDIVSKFKSQFSKFANVEFRTFLNRGHFGDSMEKQEVPELISYFGSRQYRALFEENLPLELPTDVDFIPEGYSPLSRSVEYSARIKEKFGQEWTPEFDTMDTFVCSSWYFYRFLDPNNDQKLADSDLINKWMPVDLYMIGAEHTVLHLMYSRFFTKFLYDIGITKHDEPFGFMRHMGIIRGSDNRKMSKRWGNVINPNDVVDSYGADTLRMYEMFMGPIDQGKAWNESSVQGVKRFLDRVYTYSDRVFVAKMTDGMGESDGKVDEYLNQMIHNLEEDIVNLKFNTAVSEFMKFINHIENKVITVAQWTKFILTIAPFAPFMSDYIWQNHLGNVESIHKELWPKVDETVIEQMKKLVGVQVNGKRRGEILVDNSTPEEEIIKISMENSQISKYIVGGYKKLIYIPGKIVNFIV